MLNGAERAMIGLEIGACALIVTCTRAAFGALEDGWDPCPITQLTIAGFGKAALHFVIIGGGGWGTWELLVTNE